MKMMDLAIYDVMQPSKKAKNPKKIDTPMEGIMAKDSEGKDHLRMPEVADAPTKNIQVREEKAARKFFS